MVTTSIFFTQTLLLWLCKNLQSVNCDLTEAMEYIDTVLHKIHDMQINIDIKFSKNVKKARYHKLN